MSVASFDPSSEFGEPRLENLRENKSRLAALW